MFGGAPAPVPEFMGYFLAHGSAGDQWCGGTAIAPKVFLTAAHCVVDDNADTLILPSRMLVTFNQSDPWSALVRRKAVVDRVETFAVPPHYRELRDGGLTYDVALLQLRDPAPRTVSLLRGRPDLYLPGAQALVMGWGQMLDRDEYSVPPALLAAPMPIDEHKACSAHDADYDAAVMLCAGSRGGPAPCDGDSGGPLLVRDPASQAVSQIGVVSYGRDCEGPKRENVFANVASGPVAEFIDEFTPLLQNSTPSELAKGTGVPELGFLPLVAARWIAGAQAAYRWHAKAVRVVCARNSVHAVTCRVHYRARSRSWYFRLRISESHGSVSFRYLR